ncbi:MAG: lysylphosphatidylglycerol synthase domain-containing protein [Acidobacteriota bacterium]
MSILVTIILVIYLISFIKIQDIIDAFKNIYLSTLFAYFFLSFSGAVVRAYRYKILIDSPYINLKSLIFVTLIRNLFVDLLPARTGSLSYIYLINVRFNFPFEIAASTFLMAFFFDLASLFPFLLLSVFFTVPFISELQIVSFSFIFLILILAIIIFLSELLEILSKLFSYFSKRFNLNTRKSISLIHEKLNLIIEDIKKIKKKGIYTKVFIVSTLIRLFKYTSLYFLLHSILKFSGYSFFNLNFFKVVMGISSADLLAFLLLHGIAGFGTWEAGWTFTFSLLGFERKLAIVSGFTLHLISQFYEYLLGIISIIILALPIFSKGRNVNGIE